MSSHASRSANQEPGIISGALDVANAERIAGWAWDQVHPKAVPFEGMPPRG